VSDRPPVVDRLQIERATINKHAERALGLALANISRQLDRLIELLEARP
jgi:hypothetical protein